jgi:hypothetical protein
MRDNRFIAEHRGGSLTKVNHRKLIRWARKCSEHVLSLIREDIDNRLIYALHIAEEWENDNVKTGEAMKASLGAHTVARESSNLVVKAVARSVGHTVASAHMADHSIGGALYALKAIQLAGNSIKEETQWQTSHLEQLPSELMELVFAAMSTKRKGLKID